MGISADRSGSALSTALNLFSILSLPISPEEMDRDMATINRHMHELMPKLFEGYDRTTPPYPRNGGPVEVVSYMLVDHIEELNEFQQTLTFHGTVILNWLDERLAWEPEDFGHLDKLSFNGFDLTRFWWPGVTVKGITMPTRQLAMFHNTAYTLMYTGHIFAEMAISVKAACRLDLASYPNDNQTCFVMVFTPFYPSSRVTFTASSNVMSRHSLFSEQQMTIASGFQLDRLDSQRFYAYAKGFTLNQSEADMFSSLTNTVLRYQICLSRRDNGLYVATVSLPLFSISVMAFSAIFVKSIRLSLLWLFSCIAFLQIQNGRMSQFLPQDFDSEPFCVRFARFLLFELLLLLAYRLWFAFHLGRIQKGGGNEDADGSKIESEQGILPQFISRASPESRNSLIRLHSRIKWLLMIELVFIFFWIFWAVK